MQVAEQQWKPDYGISRSSNTECRQSDCTDCTELGKGQYVYLKILRQSLIKTALEVGPPAIFPDDGGPHMQQDALIVEQRTCTMIQYILQADSERCQCSRHPGIRGCQI